MDFQEVFTHFSEPQATPKTDLREVVNDVYDAGTDTFTINDGVVAWDDDSAKLWIVAKGAADGTIEY